MFRVERLILFVFLNIANVCVFFDSPNFFLFL
nr:MAG TPA: hypothetical protein [Microviridae sp.]